MTRLIIKTRRFFSDPIADLAPASLPRLVTKGLAVTRLRPTTSSASRRLPLESPARPYPPRTTSRPRPTNDYLYDRGRPPLLRTTTRTIGVTSLSSRSAGQPGQPSRRCSSAPSRSHGRVQLRSAARSRPSCSSEAACLALPSTHSPCVPFTLWGVRCRVWSRWLETPPLEPCGFDPRRWRGTWLLVYFCILRVM